MYTLFSGMWKYMVQKDEFSILILGLDNAGKTVSLAIWILVNEKDGQKIHISTCLSMLYYN